MGNFAGIGKSDLVFFLLTSAIFTAYYFLFGFPFGMDGKNYLRIAERGEYTSYNFMIVGLFSFAPWTHLIMFPALLCLIFLPLFRTFTGLNNKQTLLGCGFLWPMLCLGLWAQLLAFCMYMAGIWMLNKYSLNGLRNGILLIIASCMYWPGLPFILTMLHPIAGIAAFAIGNIWTSGTYLNIPANSHYIDPGLLCLLYYSPFVIARNLKDKTLITSIILGTLSELGRGLFYVAPYLYSQKRNTPTKYDYAWNALIILFWMLNIKPDI